MNAVFVFVGQLPPVVPVALAAALLLLWYVRFFCAMAPRRGTAEWIALADRTKFAPLSTQPVTRDGWIALLLVIVIATANCLLRMDAVYQGSMVYAAFAALRAVLFFAMLQLLAGSPIAALCGTVLLLLGELPPMLILLGLFFLVLALLQQKAMLRVLLVICALGSLAYYALGLDVRVQLPLYPPVYLLFASAIPVCLIHGLRRKDSRHLTAGILGLITLPLAVVGMTSTTWAGSLIAFSTTLAAGEQRGAKKSAVFAVILLIICILCS